MPQKKILPYSESWHEFCRKIRSMKNERWTLQPWPKYDSVGTTFTFDSVTTILKLWNPLWCQDVVKPPNLEQSTAIYLKKVAWVVRKQKQKLNGSSGGSVNANPSIIFKYFENMLRTSRKGSIAILKVFKSHIFSSGFHYAQCIPYWEGRWGSRRKLWRSDEQD